MFQFCDLSQIVGIHMNHLIYAIQYNEQASSVCLILVQSILNKSENATLILGAQWLSDRALDSRPKGRGFKAHRRHCVVSLTMHINPSLVLVQPRKTRPFITERLLMGRKKTNQTNKQNLYFLRKYWAKSIY